METHPQTDPNRPALIKHPFSGCNHRYYIRMIAVSNWEKRCVYISIVLRKRSLFCITIDMFIAAGRCSCRCKIATANTWPDRMIGCLYAELGQTAHAGTERATENNRLHRKICCSHTEIVHLLPHIAEQNWPPHACVDWNHLSVVYHALISPPAALLSCCSVYKSVDRLHLNSVLLSSPVMRG